MSLSRAGLAGQNFLTRNDTTLSRTEKRRINTELEAMLLSQLIASDKQLCDFVGQFRTSLGRAERPRLCKQYLAGLLLKGGRKSVEPMAARVPDADAQALQQFVNQSPWEHEAIQAELARLMLLRRIKNTQALRGKLPSGPRVERSTAALDAVLVLSDVNLPKRGRHSVGVGRQPCGMPARVVNCQSVVTWNYVDLYGMLPLLCELYLPPVWAADPPRMEKAGVPERRRRLCRRQEIAVELLERADGLLKPPNEAGQRINVSAVVCGAEYGAEREFLQVLAGRGYTFVAQVAETDVFWPAHGESLQQERDTIRARDWFTALSCRKERWQRVEVPFDRRRLIEVLAVRVHETKSLGWGGPGPEGWLLIEREGGKTLNYYLSNAPQDVPPSQLLKWAYARRRVEQGYRKMSEKLGLGHFEGRSWRGLHHHLTLCFMAYCFLQVLKKQRKRKRPR
jgi:SRSO17 transposase